MARWAENRVALLSLGERDRRWSFIDELDLSMRPYNCLKRAGVHTLADILSFSEEEIAGIRNLNAKCVAEIKEKIESLGYGFAPYPL